MTCSFGPWRRTLRTGTRTQPCCSGRRNMHSGDGSARPSRRRCRWRSQRRPGYAGARRTSPRSRRASATSSSRHPTCSPARRAKARTRRSRTPGASAIARRPPAQGSQRPGCTTRDRRTTRPHSTMHPRRPTRTESSRADLSHVGLATDPHAIGRRPGSRQDDRLDPAPTQAPRRPRSGAGGALRAAAPSTSRPRRGSPPAASARARLRMSRLRRYPPRRRSAGIRTPPCSRPSEHSSRSS